jgi:hypothetical protein
LKPGLCHPNLVSVTRSENSTPHTPPPSRHDEDNPTGQALVAAMQASPHKDIDIEPTRCPLPVRDVVL